MNLNSHFKDLLNLLNEEKARYLVVGGYAVIEYTEPRYTKDLDIWVSTDKENAERVYRALKQFGAPLTGITVDDFTDPDAVYHIGRPPARVDILMGLDGLEFEESWAKRFDTAYDDVLIQVIAADDLLVNKRLAGRLQDLIDVENLLLAEKRKGK